LLLLAALCGCDEDNPALPDAQLGDAPIDVPPGQCGATGIGNVEGTVTGTAITPVMRATLFHTAMWTIVLDEIDHPVCGDPPTTGEQLILLFCRRPTPGTFTVDGDGGCPGTTTSVLLMRDGTVFEEADSGTITITGNTDCVAGSFSATFGDEQLTGTFDAVSCPDT
jgi:hypothetical protein